MHLSLYKITYKTMSIYTSISFLQSFSHTFFIRLKKIKKILLESSMLSLPPQILSSFLLLAKVVVPRYYVCSIHEAKLR